MRAERRAGLLAAALGIAFGSAVLLLETGIVLSRFPDYPRVLARSGAGLSQWLAYAGLFGVLSLSGWLLGLALRARLGLSPGALTLLSVLALGEPLVVYPFVLVARMPALAGLSIGRPSFWLVAGGLVGLGGALLAARRLEERALRVLAGGVLVAWLALAAALQRATHASARDPAGFEALAALVAAVLVLAAPIVASLATRRPALPLAAAAIALPLAWGGWMVAAGASRGAVDAPAPVSSASPPVLLIVVDTLRADAVSTTGGPSGLTPAIDALAADGIVFERARSAAPWTTPAFGSLLTSTWPRQHGAGRRVPGAKGRGALDRSLVTVAEAFRDAGYATGASLTNAYLDRAFGLARGFERYENVPAIASQHVVAGWLHHWLLDLVGTRRAPGARGQLRAYLPAAVQRERILALVEALAASGRPFFAVGHFMDPHAPYQTPALGGGDLEARYHAEVRAADRAIGGLLDAWRRAGIYERAVIALTSDHGEELLEARPFDGRSRDHGHTLHDELLRVPLILKLPNDRRAGERVRGDVSLVDLAPTLLAAAGVPVPESFEGVDLESGVPSPGRVLFAEALLYGDEQQAAISGSLKLLARMTPPRPASTDAYDLARDAGERQPLAVGTWGASGSRLYRALLDHHERRASGAEAGVVELDPARREQLRALGYAE